MINQKKSWIVSLILSLVLMSGCATLEKQPANAAAFADAGITYTTGVNTLIDTYYASRIDSNSVDIIFAAQFISGEDASERRMTKLRTNNQSLVQAYATLSRIKQHNALLAQYFRTLAAFAGDDSARDITDELDRIVGQLSSMGLATTALTISDKTVDLSKATPLLAEAGVNAYKSVQLNEILARDGEAIAKELAVQQALVDTLATDLRSYTENIYKKTVEGKLAEDFAKGSVPKSWRAQRVQHLTRVASIDDASRTASATISDLKVKWMQFAEGSLQPSGVDGLRELATDFVRSIKEVYEIVTE
jgi:hypothetical protein